MANTKRKSGTGKSNTKKKMPQTKQSGRNGSRAPVQRSEQELKIIAEVYIWGSLALAIILFLSNFGMCGMIGNAISYFLFGLFGMIAYAFPVALFCVTAFIGANIGKGRAASRIRAFIIFYIDICIITHIALMNADTELGIIKYYLDCGENKTGGGVIGGLLGALLVRLLGIVGAYVIAIVVMIITLVIFTQKSIIESVRNYSEKAYNSAKDDMTVIKENKEAQREQRRRQRDMETKRAKGVDFSQTKITDAPEGNKTIDMHEINIEGIEPPYVGPIDVHEEDTGQYTYFENKTKPEAPKNRKGSVSPLAESDSVINPFEMEEDNTADGEFTPKERIIISEEAKKAMNRKPYQTVQAFTSEGMQEHTDEGEDSSVIKIVKPKRKMRYSKPKLDLLAKNPGNKSGTSKLELMETATRLQQILKQFGVNVTINNVSRGPSVTRYELQPEIGTKVSKITSLSDDIKLNLAASDIRIEAPIPGKAAVGIEVPNSGRDTVYLRDLIESRELKENLSKIAFAAGKDISGRVVVADIAKMPHMLVAGTTGSGKSVFTNSIIMSILYRATPDEVKLIIIDPKVVEFGIYNGIPHLMTPVVTDPKKAAGALNWAVAEMSDRYKKFAASGTRDLKGYNEKIQAGDYEGDEPPEKLPQIVIIIDELADLMMVAAKDVEEAICRLAQLARAAGIHLIIATQRPSVDVVTGLIKANIPSRVALLVSSGTDSRTIIDMNGAEKLLGNGDMLFYPSGYVKPVRVQGAFVSDAEVQRVVDYLVSNSGEVQYDNKIEVKMSADTTEGETVADDGNDAYFVDAGRLVIEKDKGSTSMIQRAFRVGFNRAARIMEQLYDAGVVGQEETNKPRRVLMSMEEFEQMINQDKSSE